MKHVDMLMILKRANAETLRLWSREHELVEMTPDGQIAKRREKIYWEQLQELHGMIVAEEKKIERLRAKQAANQ